MSSLYRTVSFFGFLRFGEYFCTHKTLLTEWKRKAITAVKEEAFIGSCSLKKLSCSKNLKNIPTKASVTELIFTVFESLQGCKYAEYRFSFNNIMEILKISKIMMILKIMKIYVSFLFWKQKNKVLIFIILFVSLTLE